MELSVLVHPFIYHNKVDNDKRKEIDYYIDNAQKLLVFYSKTNSIERKK